MIYLESLEADGELALADGEGVPQVEPAIHVRVRERYHVLLIYNKLRK